MTQIHCPECKSQISENIKMIKGFTGCAIATALVFVSFLIIVGLSQNSARTSSTSERNAVLIDVDDLANQDADYVDGILGVPSQITPITKHSLMMPREFRYYKLSEGTTANIQFYKGQAKLFSIYFSAPVSNPLSAAMRCGFESAELGGLQRAPLGSTWTRVETENARYRRVTVGGSSAGEYSVFQAEVYYGKNYNY